MDTLSPEQRSHRMSLIRGKDTKPELLVRKALHSAGFRYRLHRKDLPGKPDLAFVSARIAVFINGCFWHGHKCGIGHIPKTNSRFWQEKILANRRRDAGHIRKLRDAGWKVIVVWECKLASSLRRDTTLKALAFRLKHLLQK